jgi:hypothetical protein
MTRGKKTAHRKQSTRKQSTRKQSTRKQSTRARSASAGDRNPGARPLSGREGEEDREHREFHARTRRRFDDRADPDHRREGGQSDEERGPVGREGRGARSARDSE